MNNCLDLQNDLRCRPRPCSTDLTTRHKPPRPDKKPPSIQKPRECPFHARPNAPQSSPQAENSSPLVSSPLPNPCAKQKNKTKKRFCTTTTMGNCSSDESTSVATAKLILQDGKLQEFSCPVKVSHLLQKDPTCFICDSDQLGFNDFVSAISGDEELKPGQLYFALPLTTLRRPLGAGEMAALAVKASSALKVRGEGAGCGCRPKRMDVVVPVAAGAIRTVRDVSIGGGARFAFGSEERRKRSTPALRRGRRRNFKAQLSAIPE
ncbi:hypothetical protein ACLOJK_041145 [Asimina triloba]